ncbi:hypothetical protein [Planctomonas psychrotolerans]|uniref:hypothetical protein n=1 Tax=Planctomonas psychrotolerans TaxID=2528712 RepID=UPI001239FBB2|nr:hypothetical protein [Planctomonas psychrotolerans]
MTSTSPNEYAAELTEALEFRGVPSRMVRSIVGEVVDHVAESGGDPRVEFGEPGDYAQRFAPGFSMARFCALIVATVVLTVGGTLVLISGVFGLQNAGYTLWGLSPWMRVILGFLALLAFVVLLVVAGMRNARRTRRWQLNRSGTRERGRTSK